MHAPLEPATHRCRVCGAQWWYGYIEVAARNVLGDACFWSLRSPKCGECCDNAPDMNRVMEPLPGYEDRIRLMDVERALLE